MSEKSTVSLYYINNQIKSVMKKAMFVLAAAFVFTACGNGAESKVVTTDSTTVKTDSTKVDTTVVADTTK